MIKIVLKMGGSFMEKKAKALLISALVFSATMYFFYNFENERVKAYNAYNRNLSNSTDICIPNPEYFIDCVSHDEKMFNTTLKVHNIAIFVENVRFSDHLEIWNGVLNDFPPHAVEDITKIIFSANMTQKYNMMESDYEKDPSKPCGMKWTYYGYCVNNRIKVRENATTFLSKTSYKSYIAHEVGHSVRLNYQDMELFSYLNSLNGTFDNFITAYAMNSNMSNEDDFAESIKFWKGNTALFWNISQRNEIMQQKFEIVSRQICYSQNGNVTICPIYISQNSTADPPQNYNGTIDNDKGLFANDLRRNDIAINKNIRDLNFEDFNSSISSLKNTMEY